MEIKIKGTTATELCQIDKSEKATAVKNPKIVIKNQKVLAKNSFGNKVLATTPIYTGNSFRGKLRRKALEFLIDSIIRKGLKLPSDANFNLMNAGGGNDFQAQKFEVVDNIRQLNPIISVFGASLAVPGKLVTPNLIPFKTVESDLLEYYFGETEDGKLYSTITTTETFIKCDDLLTKSGNARFLDDESIAAWRDKVEGNNKDRASSRAAADSDEKVKKESIKSMNDREFIVRGVDLYSSIESSSNMTPIERGMIYKAIEEVSLESLGSNSSRGFGKINYEICFDENSILETKVDHYLKAHIIKKSYSAEVMEDIKAFESWLENIEENNYAIAELMKSK